MRENGKPEERVEYLGPEVRPPERLLRRIVDFLRKYRYASATWYGGELTWYGGELTCYRDGRGYVAWIIPIGRPERALWNQLEHVLKQGRYSTFTVEYVDRAALAEEAQEWERNQSPEQ